MIGKHKYRRPSYGQPTVPRLVWSDKGRGAIPRDQIERESRRGQLLYAAAMRGDLLTILANEHPTNH